MKVTTKIEIADIMITCLLYSAIAYAIILSIGCQGPSGNTIVGPQGPQGAIGDTGPKGNQGDAGQNGLNGSNGIDATSVTIVQLCPGTSNYGTFIEVGFCVQGNLYGTYSANGGFSTLLAPGSYSSNAIESSCNFTVLPDCIIEN